MILKQITKEKRIIFLREFTKELIKNTIQKEILENKIKAEKIKQKYISPPMDSDTAIKLTANKAFEPSKYSIDEIPIKKPELTTKTKPIAPIKKTHSTVSPQGQINAPQRKPMIKRAKGPQRNISKSFLKKIKKRIRKNQVRQIPEKEINALQIVKPEPGKTPQGFSLGKIEVFLKDPTVQSIECAGPGQNILIKKMGRITPARLMLSQEEINNIINTFSTKASIPVVKGMIKAAVGNLILSAVISDFVGSRFIISKIPQQNK